MIDNINFSMSRYKEQLNALDPDQRNQVCKLKQQLKDAYKDGQLYNYLHNLIVMELNTGNEKAFDLFLFESELLTKHQSETDSDDETVEDDYFMGIALKIETQFLGEISRRLHRSEKTQ